MSQKWPVWDFPGGPLAKNPPANAGDMGSIPGLPHASEQLSMCTTTPEPALENPQATTTEAHAP